MDQKTIKRINSQYLKNKPWSYGGRGRVFEANKHELTQKNVEEILSYNDIYTRYKRHRRARKYSPIYVYKKRELFQADVVFFTDGDFVDANNGYKYLFTCIDCFTKYAWIFPMKKNDCETVMNCFKQVLTQCGKKPDRLNSDRGSELICKKFALYLKKNKIHHYLSYSLRKCPIIERFNLTIQNLLYRIMASNQSYEWSRFTEKAMQIYLNRKHRTIGMSPMEAELEANEIKVREAFLRKYNKAGLKYKKPKFGVGDTVRIWSERKTFARGYDEDYSIEHFTITEVKTNLPVPRYKLDDSEGEAVEGSFFEDELVSYNPDEWYRINIIDERVRKGVKEYLVNFIGYSKKSDKWMTAKEIKKI